MQNSGGVFFQVLKQYALMESQEPSFASRKKMAIISFPGSVWERNAARLCLDADEAEPGTKEWVPAVARG